MGTSQTPAITAVKTADAPSPSSPPVSAKPEGSISPQSSSVDRASFLNPDTARLAGATSMTDAVQVASAAQVPAAPIPAAPAADLPPPSRQQEIGQRLISDIEAMGVDFRKYSNKDGKLDAESFHKALSDAAAKAIDQSKEIPAAAKASIAKVIRELKPLGFVDGRLAKLFAGEEGIGQLYGAASACASLSNLLHTRFPSGFTTNDISSFLNEIHAAGDARRESITAADLRAWAFKQDPDLMDTMMAQAGSKKGLTPAIWAYLASSQLYAAGVNPDQELSVSALRDLAGKSE